MNPHPVLSPGYNVSSSRFCKLLKCQTFLVNVANHLHSICLLADFPIRRFGGGGGGIITANKAAKRPTTIQSHQWIFSRRPGNILSHFCTRKAFFKATCRHFHPFLLRPKSQEDRASPSLIVATKTAILSKPSVVFAETCNWQFAFQSISFSQCLLKLYQFGQTWKQNIKQIWQHRVC